MKKSIYTILMPVLALSCAFAPYYLNFSLVDVQRRSPAPDTLSTVAAFKEHDTTATRYGISDSLVDIRFFITMYQLEFALTNKSGRTMRIDWEKAAYINPRGERMRIIHKGVAYAQKDALQYPANIYNGETLSEVMVPAQNIRVYLYGSGGWYMAPLFSNGDFGRTASAIIPIEIDRVPYEYIIRFVIKPV
jgi:hypothetical protein